MMNYPPESSGILLSGASMANVTALTIARDHQLNLSVRNKGLRHVEPKMVLYCSEETHSCVQKAVELIGLGTDSIRKISTDAGYRINTELLTASIEKDILDGFTPFCIVGNAGTVNTGAIDPIEEISAIAKKYNLWLHIDGAFGALAKMVPEYEEQLRYIEQADSLAFDLHKWMYMPYGVGCTLVKDRVAHYSTFVYGHEAQYLKTIADLSKAQGDYLSNPSYLALPLSREFRSLKVYMLMRAYGLDKYSNLIQQNLDQAVYLKRLVEGDSEMELCAPVASNVVCFRFKPDGFTEVELDALNKSISDSVNKVCVFMVSDTRVKGKYCLRAAITNHRSRREDFDYIYNLVKDLGDKALQKMKN